MTARNLTATAEGRRIDHPLPGDGSDPAAMLTVYHRLAPYMGPEFVWYTSPVAPRR